MSDKEETTSDPSVVINAITAFLLGELPSLRREDVARLSGVPTDVTRERWRALGFPAVDDDAVAFTHADVEALQLTQKLIDTGVIQEETEDAFIRTTGRAFARLADWQARAVISSVKNDGAGESLSLDLLDEIVPAGEQVQSYVWRRHLVGAVTRLLLTEATDSDSVDMCAGFADIVGFTSRSRRMTTDELATMVERFETVTTGLITDHHGRVIKTIGDEVLFVVDAPDHAALLALGLLELHENDDSFPEVRVGMAHGNVLNRLGDVFGPVVNLASRLTSIARPGRSVVDRGLAEQLRGHPEFRLRRIQRTSVKGYDHLEPWSLTRTRDRKSP